MVGDSGTAVQRSRLRRELRRLDTIFFLISAMVVVDTIGAIAIGGAQTFTWLLVLFVFFFVPSALCSAELGAAMPEEGGVYVWVRRCFGRFAGGAASLLYWAGTPMWLGGSVAVVAMAVVGRFLGRLDMAGMYVFGTGFIAVATVAAIVPLRIGKWIPTSGALTQIVLLAFFVATAVVYGLDHGLHGLSGGAFVPTDHTFILVVPILIYSFVGIELPTSAAEEMVDPRRDIPAAIGRAGIGQLFMYAVPILTVLLVLPPARVSSLHGLIDAMATVFAVYGGHVDGHGHVLLTGMGSAVGAVAGLAFVWVLLASGATWVMGAGRAQAAACMDGAGPRWLGHISERTGVPVNMGLVTGGLSLLTMIVDLSLTSGNGQRYFSAALTVAVALIMLAYLIIFPTFVALRIQEPDLERPFRVPGGRPFAWLITTLATGWSLLATVCLLWPGVLTAHSDTALPAGFAGDRGGFELLVLGPIVLLLAFYALYASTATQIVPSPTVAAPPAPGAAPPLTGDPTQIEQ